MYFKESGKFYSDGAYLTLHKDIYAVADEIRAMDKHPGLVSRWKGDIMIQFMGVPHLIKQ